MNSNAVKLEGVYDSLGRKQGIWRGGYPSSGGYVWEDNYLDDELHGLSTDWIGNKQWTLCNFFKDLREGEAIIFEF